MKNKATCNFQLRNTKSKTDTPVEAHIRINGNRIKYPTGVKVSPVNWDKRVSRGSYSYFKAGTPNAISSQQTLRQIDDAVQSVFSLYLLNNGIAPEVDAFREMLDVELGRAEEKKPITFYQFFDQSISEREKQMLNDGRDVTGNTTLTKYRQTKRVLKEFEDYDGQRITFQSIDLQFYYRFVDWMLDERVYKSGNINKHLANLKALLNQALEEGVTDNRSHKHKKFKTVQERETFEIALSEKEIDEIFNLDLSDSKRLDRVRDCFILSCCTALRYSDFSKLNRKHIISKNGKRHLVIKVKKTGKPVVLPVLDDRLTYVLDKYEDSETGFPNPYSNQEMNRKLKTLGKRCSLLHKVERFEEQEGRDMIEMEKMRWELMKTHTGRRSFATNLYNMGLPPQYIMLLTGHTTEKSFFRYVRITPTDFTDAFETVFLRGIKNR